MTVQNNKISPAYTNFSFGYDKYFLPASFKKKLIIFLKLFSLKDIRSVNRARVIALLSQENSANNFNAFCT